MYVWESYEVQYLANDASKLQTFDEKSVKMLIVWHRRESDIPVDICKWSPISRTQMQLNYKHFTLNQ